MSMRPPAFAQPLLLRQLTRIESEALTLLATRVRALAWPAGSPEWRVTLEPAPDAAPSGTAADDWQLRVRWDGVAFDALLPATAADTWIAAEFPDLDLPALPPAYRCAIVEAMLGELAQSWAIETSPRVESVETGCVRPAVATGFHRLCLLLERGNARIEVTICVDAQGLTSLAGKVAEWPAARGPLDADALPVLLRAEIGTSRIALAELRSLKPGDAVLVQDYWVANDRQLLLRHGDCALRVRAEDTRLVVTRAFQPEEDDMTSEEEDFGDPASPSPAGDEPLALGDLPVRIHFDLGSRRLALADVTALQVGQVLELNRPLSRAVNIRANGALIGTGELVEIGGRIAVSITTLGRMQETGDADERA